jgi:hypothetical protein
MAESNIMTGRGADHANEQAKPEINRVAELVRPVTPLPGHAAGHTFESPSLADLLGIDHPSPALGEQGSVQVADVEKTWQEKEIERREKAGNTGGGSDGNWTERARILPVEQQEEKEIERER